MNRDDLSRLRAEIQKVYTDYKNKMRFLEQEQLSIINDFAAKLDEIKSNKIQAIIENK